MSTYTKPTLQRYGSFREVTRWFNGTCFVWVNPNCGNGGPDNGSGGGTGDSGLGDGFQDRS